MDSVMKIIEGHNVRTQMRDRIKQVKENIWFLGSLSQDFPEPEP